MRDVQYSKAYLRILAKREKQDREVEASQPPKRPVAPRPSDDRHGPFPNDRSILQVREVYFIRAATMGLIKIGTANFALMRLPSLQTGSPDKLELMGVIICDRAGAREKEIHWQFEHLRSHGEWYRPGVDLLEFIAANVKNYSDASLDRKRAEDAIWEARKKTEAAPQPGATP